MTPVRILIADDHEVVRHGVRSILEREPGWIVCGEASNGREAVMLAARLRPDVVVLDITMPELNGLDATRQILQSMATEILILTMHESDQMLWEILDAGASGYLLKSDAGRRLIDAVRTLLGHGKYLSDRFDDIGSRMTRWETETRRRHASTLTPREREVLQLLSEGRSNKEIGVALGITTKTAETHRSRIMSKLNLHSVADLVRYAIRNGITGA